MSNQSPYEEYIKVLLDNINFVKKNKTLVKIFLQKTDESNINNITIR